MSNMIDQPSNIQLNRSSLLDDKNTPTLTEILHRSQNQNCVDCGTRAPRWSSVNLGVFVCIECAGYHRNLGVHISVIKSVTLDTWNPQWVKAVNRIGNDLSNKYYLYNYPSDAKHAPIGERIKNKYVKKLYTPDNYPEPCELFRSGQDPIHCLPVSITNAHSIPNPKSSTDTRNRSRKCQKNKEKQESDLAIFDDIGQVGDMSSNPRSKIKKDDSDLAYLSDIPQLSGRPPPPVKSTIVHPSSTMEQDLNELFMTSAQQQKLTLNNNPNAVPTDDFPSVLMSLGYEICPPTIEDLHAAKIQAAKESINVFYKQPASLGLGEPSYPVMHPESAFSLTTKNNNPISEERRDTVKEHPNKIQENDDLLKALKSSSVSLSKLLDNDAKDSLVSSYSKTDKSFAVNASVAPGNTGANNANKHAVADAAFQSVDPLFAKF